VNVPWRDPRPDDKTGLCKRRHVAVPRGHQCGACFRPWMARARTRWANCFDASAEMAGGAVRTTTSRTAGSGAGDVQRAHACDQHDRGEAPLPSVPRRHARS
jgi:hypothetical protein